MRRILKINKTANSEGTFFTFFYLCLDDKNQEHTGSSLIQRFFIKAVL